MLGKAMVLIVRKAKKEHALNIVQDSTHWTCDERTYSDVVFPKSPASNTSRRHSDSIAIAVRKAASQVTGLLWMSIC